MKHRARFAVWVAVLALFATVVWLGSTSPVLAKDKEYFKELRVAEPLPPQSFAGQMHQWWAKELEKRTNGRVKVKFFWMESLVKWKDMLQGVSSGIADVGTVAATYHPSDLPLYMLLDNPLNAVDYWAGTRACTDACLKQPDLVAELKKNNLKHVVPWNSGRFNFCTKKKWTELSELKGKTFRSYGGAQIDYLQNLGINPIFMPYSEIYEALQRGAIDGNGTCVLQLSDALKHYETIEQCTNMQAGFVVGGSSLAMNYKVWEAMPKDIQEIIDQLNYDTGDHWAKSLYEVEAQIAEKWKTKYGILMNELTPEQLKVSNAAAEKADETFINNLEAKGLHAQQVWEYFRGQVVGYEKEVKAKGHPWDRK